MAVVSDTLRGEIEVCIDKWLVEMESQNDPNAKVVDFELLVKWGYTGSDAKSNAKRTLLSTLNSSEYAISVLRDGKSRRGRPPERILLTLNAAKQFLLQAPTAKGQVVRQIFIDRERSWRNMRDAIDAGDIAIRDTHSGREIDNSFKWRERDSEAIVKYKSQLDPLVCDANSNTSVVYIGYIGQREDGDHYFKFGESRQFSVRAAQHLAKFGTFETIGVWKCDNRENVELTFKRYLNTRGLLRCIDVDGQRQTEVFVTNEGVSLNQLNDTMSAFVASLGKSDDIARLELQHQIEILKLRHELDMLRIQVDIILPGGASRARRRLTATNNHQIEEYFNVVSGEGALRL